MADAGTKPKIQMAKKKPTIHQPMARVLLARDHRINLGLAP